MSDQRPEAGPDSGVDPAAVPGVDSGVDPAAVPGVDSGVDPAAVPGVALSPAVAQALVRLAREESGRVIAILARQFGDLDLADDSVQDALLEATTNWPSRGIPGNPAGWLMTVARNRGIDRLRRAASARRRTLAAAAELVAEELYDDEELIVDEGSVGDEHLRLMLLCCHPALDRDTQVALTLRLVGGLTTPEIASAFLLPTATLAQRIVRAKRKIRDAGIPLSIPAALDERIEALLGVLYLVFNEGYLSRGDGDAAIRVDLVDQSLRLTRLAASLLQSPPAPHDRPAASVAALPSARAVASGSAPAAASASAPVPALAEVEGLLALELYTRARLDARLDGAGDLVLLEDQDRSRWDLASIGEANSVLATAMSRMHPGPYQLQAVIAGQHANARTSADTDWPAIVRAYGQLLAMTSSPVVALNRAAAVAMADGPQAGLALLDGIHGLDGYHLLHATRAELAVRAGDVPLARAAFARARALTDNPAEQRHLDRRIASLG